MNENNNYQISSTSCFVNYIDYTSTSLSNYSNIFCFMEITNEIDNQTIDIPNNATLQAVSEARNHGYLKNHKTIDDFFINLEK